MTIFSELPPMQVSDEKAIFGVTIHMMHVIFYMFL